MRDFLRLLLPILIFQAVFFSCNPDRAPKTNNRPNIVWIFVEDMNDWMGCYGDKTVPTPNIDKLAEGGIRFDRAYMPAGVCSATRSAIALGTMQTTLGVHNHRSSRQRTPNEKFQLPEHVKTVYQLMRSNGYHVINSGSKNDFNFLWPTQNEKELDKIKGAYGTGAYYTDDKKELLYDVNKPGWGFSRDLLKSKPEGKPVFLQVQLIGGKGSGKYEGAKIDLTQQQEKVGRHTIFTDLDKVQVMPYYPDISEVRKEIAHHYDNIRLTDNQVEEIIDALKKEGLYENTVIFFWTDHGMKLPRHKQWLYEGGIHVPFVMAGPGVEKGKIRKDLISGIDITSTTLTLGGIDIPDWMEGKNLLDEDDKREFVISARDRCDYTIERVRAVTTKRFKYIRNFLTDRPFMQPQYRDGTKYMKEMKAYFEAGKMNEIQTAMWSSIRVPEEFYDLENDPHEINNLANDAAYKSEIERHQKILENWIYETDDKGQYPEAVDALKGVLTQWSKVAVNPEYDKA
ncbi:MAG: sulfatase, partial [Cyclobacteriaceae bacterium]|nr:sulfatase [Cyclobacteriaceae bacterium]